MGTAIWESCCRGSDADTSWEVEWLGNQSLGLLELKAVGLWESPQQGREVKHALESPVTGRQVCSVCLPLLGLFLTPSH